MLSKAKHALWAGVSLGLASLANAGPAYASDIGQESAPTTASPEAATAGGEIAAQPESSDAPPAATATEPGTAASAGDIVVTSQRRSERLQDVPLAITAITPEAATQSGLRSMVDIKFATPGVDMTASTGFAMLYMRGIGVGFNTPGLEPPVAVYLDNMYLPRTGGLNTLLDLVDPGTIEIIRGPQGTLYGRNATGGVIRISSANPTDRLEGRLMAEYGRFDHKQVDGMLNIPVSDDLSLRFAGRRRKEDGYVSNFDGHKLGQVNNYTARGRLKWTPSEAIEVVGGVEWQHSKARDYNDRLGLGAPTCFVCLGTGEEPPEDFYDAAINVPEPFRNRAFRSDLRVTFDLNDFVLTSTTTYFNNNSVQNADNDFTSAPIFFFNVLANGGKTFGQEFQVAYDNDGPLSYIFAVSYLRDKAFIDIALEGLGFEGIRDASGEFPENRARLKTESVAALLEGVYRLSDTLKVTLGGRYTYDKRKRSAVNNAGFQFLGAPESHSDSKSFRAFTPRFVLAWDNGPTNIYYSYTRGFKAGGFLSPAPFQTPAVDPEKIFNHEVGVKHRAFGGKLQTNLSMFYYKNKDIQQQIIDASVGTITENAGSAEGYGAELEVLARPLKGLAVGGSIGYLHAEYSDYKNAAVVCFDPTGTSNPGFPGATLFPCRTDLTGTPLPHAPKWTVSANASYTFPIGSWSASVAGLAQYRSSSLFWPGAGGELRFDRQKGYTVANFSGYVSPPGDNLRLGFYVDNAFNKKYATIRTTSQPWGTSFEAAKPITYGARVEYKF
jgi:iron complex outermembrane recepter protein